MDISLKTGKGDLEEQIIHVTDISKPNKRKCFWIEKLMTYCPKELNLRTEIKIYANPKIWEII